jgi:hypothetical protein
MDELGLCSVTDLLLSLMDVEYDCHIGGSLEVHDTEIQLLESFAAADLPQRVTTASLYDAFQRRLLERSTHRGPPEGMPARFNNNDNNTFTWSGPRHCAWPHRSQLIQDTFSESLTPSSWTARQQGLTD